MTEFYEEKLNKAVIENDTDYNFPTMRVIKIISIYRIITIIIIIFSCTYFLAIFWHIFVKDLVNWQYVDNIDVYNGYTTFYSYEDYGFSETHDDDKMNNLVKFWYFAITTLSTIGYGDYCPKSVNEKWVNGFILLVGVAIYSLIMNYLIQIIDDYKKIEEVGKHKDLSNWIIMLQKFNGGNPLSKDVITKIEDFFEFYW